MAILSWNIHFECIYSLQCYELTWRYSHLLFTQISPLSYAVYLWQVHCECAMKHNRRQIFNYLPIGDTHWNFIQNFHKKAIFSSKIETSFMDNLYLKPKTETFTEQMHGTSYVIVCELNSILFKLKKIIAGSFSVSLFIDFGCPDDLGTGPWHFYDIRKTQNCSVWNRLIRPTTLARTCTRWR